MWQTLFYSFHHWPLFFPEFHLYWQVSLFSLCLCRIVMSRCPSLSLWLSPTQNRFSWSTVRTPPCPQAPRLLLGLERALPPGQTTRVQARGRAFYQQTQRRAKTSSTWSREWPVSWVKETDITHDMPNKNCGSVANICVYRPKFKGFIHSVPTSLTNKTLTLTHHQMQILL